jgi:hypothetical protein
MTRRRHGRRTGALLLTTGLLCLGGAVVPLVTAHADADLGSGLGSFALSANAPVLQARFDYAEQRCAAESAGTAGCEGVLNESVAQLSNGPLAYGLASVAWPGTLPGNLGSLLIAAGNGQVPPEAVALNSPIRAEAHTGDKPVVTDYPPAPAPVLAHMKADAQGTKVTAEAAVGGLQQPTIGSLGASTSSSTTELTGVSSAKATAKSAVQDVTIAGVLHLGAVTSEATATTDGTTAKASGRTIITGASVLGIPVSIDENGITVNTNSVPIPSAAVDAVNTALAGAGITVSLSKPHGTPVGSSVQFDAGVLALVWTVQPGMIVSVEIGGAQVSVAATKGFVFEPPSTTGGTTGGFLPGTTGGSVVPPPLTGGTDVPPLTGGITPPPTLSGGPQAFDPAPAGYAGGFPHGLSPWLGGLVVVGSFLTMAGLRRLPDRVLVASTSSCPNGVTS